MKRHTHLAAILATSLTFSALSPIFSVTQVKAAVSQIDSTSSATIPTEGLIISEYVHGSSNNKAIELFNAGTTEVNLSDFSLQMLGFTNAGGVANNPLSLPNVVLEPYETYVVYHSVNGTTAHFKEVIANIQADGVKTFGSTASFFGFNGDDAIILTRENRVADIVGSTTIGAGVKPYDLSTLVRTPHIRNGIKESANEHYSPTVDETMWSMRTTGSDFSTLGYHDFELPDASPDTVAPVIEHTPVTSTINGERTTITANVSDDRVVRSVNVFWREAGTTDFTQTRMTATNGQYTTLLDTRDITTAIEYYIVASDGTNETVTDTYTIAIDLSDLQGPIIVSTTPRSGQNVGDITETAITVHFRDESVVTVGEMIVNGEAVETTLTADQLISEVVAIGENNTVSVTLVDEHGNETTHSWSFRANNAKLSHYYGQLHAHSTLSDGAGEPEEAFRFADQVAELDFFALTDHSNWFDNDTKASMADGSASQDWNRGNAAADDANRPGEYTSLFGFEMTWSGSTGGYGHINTFNTPGFETRTNSAMKLEPYYAAIAEYPQSVSQLNHPGKTFGDFSDFGFYTAAADAVVNLVEVGNGEGPIRGQGYFPSYDYYTRALDRGWHVSPANNQDNHKGNWGLGNTARTVVIAEENTREGLYEAMQANRVYASEDNNLEINYTLNGEVMGTKLPEADTVTIKVDAKDPDSNDAIGKISIITDGGYVAASQVFDTNEASWTITLPAQFSYYYVRIDQADKDIAVTSPVWVGEKDAVSLDSVKTASDKVIIGDTFDASTTITNNSDKNVTDVVVEWFVDSVEGAPVATSVVPVVEAGKMATVEVPFTAEKVGNMTIYARATLNDKIQTTSKRLNVVNANDVVQVLVDGSKDNQYVTGNYAGYIGKFQEIMAQRDVIVRVSERASEITAETLAGMSALLITDPEGRGGVSGNTTLIPSKYSDAEIAVIAEYVDNGGNLVITSRADYGDAKGEFSNGAQLNPILEAIGTTLRVNDDQVQDLVKFNNQTFRLSFDTFLEDPYGLTKGITSSDPYSFYSGASVLPGDAGSCLVKGHATTETMDMDGDNDNVPVEKGNVCAIAAQQMTTGGKVVVSGTTFYSDFEIDNDNITANQLLTQSIMEWVAPEKEVELLSIADFRQQAQGQRFSVEGYVTSQSSAVEPKNGFFDTIHIQDATGGLTVFGVSERELKLGQKVRVTGYTDMYDGDFEITLTNEMNDVIVLDEVRVIEPTQFPTVETMDYMANGGLLVATQGIVSRIEGQSVFINDGTGEARIFLDGYIGNGVDEASKGKWDARIEVGTLVSAIGIASHDVEGARIRVRNSDEIVFHEVIAEEVEAEITDVIEVAGQGRYEVDPEVQAALNALQKRLETATDQVELRTIVIEMEALQAEVVAAVEAYDTAVVSLATLYDEVVALLTELGVMSMNDADIISQIQALLAEIESLQGLDLEDQKLITTSMLQTYIVNLTTLVDALANPTPETPETPEVPGEDGENVDGEETPEVPGVDEEEDVDGDLVPETPGTTTPPTSGGSTTTTPEQLPTTGAFGLELLAIGAAVAAGGTLVYRRKKQ